VIAPVCMGPLDDPIRISKYNKAYPTGCFFVSTRMTFVGGTSNVVFHTIMEGLSGDPPKLRIRSRPAGRLQS